MQVEEKAGEGTLEQDSGRRPAMTTLTMTLTKIKKSKKA